MKKFLTISVVVFLTVLSVHGQDYKKFRVGIGLGYAKAGGEGASGGALWSVEPGYRVSDKMLMNLRVELASVVRSTTGEASTSNDLSCAGISSYTVNGQYYFRNSRSRAFAGVGLGIFSSDRVEIEYSPVGNNTISTAKSEGKLGFYPRVGLDLKHFTITVDYNLIPKTETHSMTANGIVDSEFKNSYIGIRIGGYFGGGKKLIPAKSI